MTAAASRQSAERLLIESASSVAATARRLQALARHEPCLNPAQRKALEGAALALLAALPLVDQARLELASS